MRKTSTKKKTFRDFDGYDLGAGKVKIEYRSLENRETPFGIQNWALSSYDSWVHTLPSNWADVPTVETLFHEINEFLILRADLKSSIPKEVIEVIMSTLGAGYAEIATRNPGFWASLSLKGD